LKNIIILLLFATIFISGCVGTIPYWVRRSVVHDDWIYIKSDKVLYRRYVPNGIRLEGNKDLLKKVKSITSNNQEIKVYKNYEDAKNDLNRNFVVHESSRKFIPTSLKDISKSKSLKRDSEIK